MISSYLEESVLGKALQVGRFSLEIHDIRRHGVGRHRQCDDYPFGGGQGMVMRPEPLVASLEEVRPAEGEASRRILLVPDGVPFTQTIARRYASLDRLILLCGRYEGVDERVRAYVDEEISLGDFVMTGGEIAALAVVDATARLLPGVLGNVASPVEESFQAGLLEHPQYTRPRTFQGRDVPEVLLSGDHARIAAWREEMAVRRTFERRPELLSDRDLPKHIGDLVQLRARAAGTLPPPLGDTIHHAGSVGPPGGGATRGEDDHDQSD